MPILTDDTNNPAVRAAIDANLTTADVPDAVIALAIYRGAADLDIQRRDPDWATRSGDALQHLVNAVVLMTAARLVPALPAVTREAFPDYSYSLVRQDPAAQAAELRRLALAELGLAVGADPADSLPTFFTIARGTRVSDGR